MSESLPVVLVPGLLCSARLYAHQLPELWRHGPVTVADVRRGDTMVAIAARILAAAPPRFTLVGLSMGGYLVFEIVRQAPERVAALALLSTAARPDTPEQTQRRRALIELTRGGRFAEVADVLFPALVHPCRHGDDGLRGIVRLMADETGPEAFVRQQQAIIDRPDSRPDLAAIRCPTLVLVGDCDEITPPDRAAEMAEGIAAAKLVVVPECAHLSSLDRPRQVTEALVAWLPSRA